MLRGKLCWRRVASVFPSEAKNSIIRLCFDIVSGCFSICPVATVLSSVRLFYNYEPRAQSLGYLNMEWLFVYKENTGEKRGYDCNWP
jgi:hypothetical protein